MVLNYHYQRNVLGLVDFVFYYNNWKHEVIRNSNELDNQGTDDEETINDFYIWATQKNNDSGSNNSRNVLKVTF